MRLIDADALHEALKNKQKWVVRRGDKHNEGYTYDQVHFAIDEAPTIEAVSIDDYRSMENTCYKLQKALYDMADRKTESDSEIPNNCEDEPKIECLEWYDKKGNYHRYPKTELQFDKDINVRSKDEPKLSEIPTSKCHYEPQTEPQTDCQWK